MAYSYVSFLRHSSSRGATPVRGQPRPLPIFVQPFQRSGIVSKDAGSEANDVSREHLAARAERLTARRARLRSRRGGSTVSESLRSGRPSSKPMTPILDT